MSEGPKTIGFQLWCSNGAGQHIDCAQGPRLATLSWWLGQIWPYECLFQRRNLLTQSSFIYGGSMRLRFQNGILGGEEPPASLYTGLIRMISRCRKSAAVSLV